MTTNAGTAALRALVLVTLGAMPRVLFVLLGNQPVWLLVMHGALLVHSSMAHAGLARLAQQQSSLAGYGRTYSAAQGNSTRLRSPQRQLMLMVAPVLAVAFTFQWDAPQLASCALPVLLAPALWIWVLQWSAGKVPKK